MTKVSTWAKGIGYGLANGGSLAIGSSLIIAALFFLSGCTLAPVKAPAKKAPALASVPALSSDELNLPWQSADGASALDLRERQRQYLALLADDVDHPDAHGQLSELYFKQYLINKNAEFKHWALYHGHKALKAKPQDLTLLAAYYRLLYSQVRLEGELQSLAQLKGFYAGLPEVARKSFYPPSLAFYLYQLEQDKPPRDNSRRGELKTILQQALKEQPSNALIHLQLSRYYFDARQIDVAFAMLHQALRLEPDSTQVVLALAEAYRTRAQRSECIYTHLDDLKRSSGFYKQLLLIPTAADEQAGAQATLPQVHWGLMINYAHLGLAPLSLREGDQAINADSPALNKWFFATYLTYQNQSKRAEAFFSAAKSQLPKTPTRAEVEHYLLQGQWQKAAEAFGRYIADSEQPGVTDLLLASMIQVELQDKSVSIASLWRTPKKAVYFNEFDEALAKYWRGELTEALFAAQVKSVCQQAEFEFYVGYLNLLNNRVAKAKEAFESAKAHPQPLNFEVQMAARFFQSLLNNRAPAK